MQRSKAIDRLVFSVKSEKRPELEVLQPPSPPQLEFPLETEPEDQVLLEGCMNRYGLSESQRSTLQNHYAKRGVAYASDFIDVNHRLSFASPQHGRAKRTLAAAIIAAAFLLQSSRSNFLCQTGRRHEETTAKRSRA